MSGLNLTNTSSQYIIQIHDSLYGIFRTCCSEEDSGVKAEQDVDIPEDSQPSADEEEELQKTIGQVFNLHTRVLCELFFYEVRYSCYIIVK